MGISDLNFDQCYSAVASRDARFDGRFIVGVRTTGIYCRPSCPTPITPKRENVQFYVCAAAAQLAGFRACKRCRPDAIPGSPEWDTRADLVGRAMRLIADGAVDRDGVAGLARRLAVSERHLHRILVDAVGAPPLALARAQRAQTARVLIETTELTFGDIAFAAGFPSIRQFNETIREVFAATPSTLRGATRRGQPAEAGTLTVRLPLRPPYDAGAVLRWLGHRAVAGVEDVDGGCYRRTLTLPGGTGTVTLKPAASSEASGKTKTRLGRPAGNEVDHVLATLRLGSIADLPAAVARSRRLLDLDADPESFGSVLGADEVIERLVRARPGLRAPGAVDGAEWAVRVILGQHISVRAARTVGGRLVSVYGKPLDRPDGSLTHAFPSPETLAEADLESLGLTKARAAAVRTLARHVAGGELVLDVGADRREAEERLLTIPGVGPWTVAHVALRSLGDPDAFPAGDLGLRLAATRLGLADHAVGLARRANRWRPWRGYAAHYLWEVPL
ncbi:MAG TPA: AlkA N-terminal domain-containing protein [Actinomycetota bacterium]|jgi:AraC family transcriptional regulator of adaptative response / DNA-3-methyladenine glycosylase II